MTALAQARTLLGESSIALEAVATLLNLHPADDALWEYAAAHLDGERNRVPSEWRDVERQTWNWVTGVECHFCLDSPAVGWGLAHCDHCRNTGWLVRPMWVKRTPVTVKEYLNATHTHPGDPPCSTAHAGALPVTNVSHDEAVAFCNELTRHDLLGGKEVPQPGNNPFSVMFRLPSADEWRHLAGEVPKCGEDWTVIEGDDSDPFPNEGWALDPHPSECPCDGTGLDFAWLDAHAWTARNSGGYVHPVGTREAGRFGLADCFGNVDEVTADTNALGDRVIIGGSYAAARTYLGVRFWSGDARDQVGFRPVRTAP